MYYKFSYQKYDSKLATVISLLQASFWVGFSLFFIIFNIPSFITLICNAGYVVGILFAVMTILAVAAEFLLMIFVDAQKVNNFMCRKKKKKFKKTYNENLNSKEIEFLMPDDE